MSFVELYVSDTLFANKIKTNLPTVENSTPANFASSRTATLTDLQSYLWINTSGGNITITLPTAATIFSATGTNSINDTVSIKIQTGGHTVTIAVTDSTVGLNAQNVDTIPAIPNIADLIILRANLTSNPNYIAFC
jgi:hypothetical protein